MNAPALRHAVEINYCTQCRWLLRAGWMAQELLSTFDGDLEAVTLRPGTGGVSTSASTARSFGLARARDASRISSS
jgi:predicted Rdx family selenoprotein